MLHTSRVDYANDISIASSMFGSTTVHIRRICQQPKRYAELAGVGITLLMHRGRRRAVEGIVTGTALLSSTILLAKAIVIHQLALRDYLLYVRRISRGHRLLRRVAARLQRRQAPRGAIRLDPRCGPDGASLARRAYSRRGAYLQFRNKHQVLPLPRHSEDGPAGAGERRHLHGPPVLYYTPQVGKGLSPTMQGIRRSRW